MANKKIMAFLLVFLIASIQFCFAQQISLLYDQNGNTIQDSNNFYEYNKFNQLRTVRANNSIGRILEKYVYGPEGERIKKVAFNSDGSNTTTYYAGSNFVRVVNKTGSFDTKNIYADGALVARQEASGKKFYYHPDQLGSTDIITDQSGKLVGNTDYTAFGAAVTGGTDRYLFTGKEKDSGSGLLFFGARYYNPIYGIFSQPDTILPNAYDPQLLNMYAYARNNPLKYNDKSGHLPVPIITGFVGGVIGGTIGAAVSAYLQYKETGHVDVGQTAKAALIGFTGGFVTGATFGAATPYISGAYAAGGFWSALPIVGIAGGTSGVAGGQASHVADNALSGRAVTEGLGNPKEMGGDFLISAAGSMVTYGLSYGISSIRTANQNYVAPSSPDQVTKRLGVTPQIEQRRLGTRYTWKMNDNTRIFYDSQGHATPIGESFIAEEQLSHYSVVIRNPDTGEWVDVINPNYYLPGKGTSPPRPGHNFLPGDKIPINLNKK